MRALQTAKLIGEQTSKTIETSDLFVERSKPSCLEGKPWSDPELHKVWEAWEQSLMTPGMQIEDGENFDSIVRRSDQALRFTEERDEESFLIVSHGHFIRTIIARVMLGDALTGESLKRFHDLIALENGSVSTLELNTAQGEDCRWQIVMLNDHSHFVD